jgi:ABC-type Fe3+-hydroxamate transport system substrate-binding protein
LLPLNGARYQINIQPRVIVMRLIPTLKNFYKRNPTLIILPRLANPLWTSRCQQAGLKVLVLSPESKNSVLEDIRLISAAVHQEDLGNNLIAKFSKPQTAASQKVLIIWDGMMAGKNSYLAGPLEKVGCEFPFAESTWIKYDSELIAQFNPDLILWINSNPSDGPITFADESIKEFEKLTRLKST